MLFKEIVDIHRLDGQTDGRTDGRMMDDGLTTNKIAQPEPTAKLS